MINKTIGESMKSNRIIRAFVTTFLISILLCFPAFAKEKGIVSIDITAVLSEDGSCNITEVWEIDDVYDGTEYYIGLHNLDDMSVTDLMVTDDSGTVYQTLDEWNLDETFEEKAYKCGILEVDNGYEICWGISEMGNRTYTVSYRLNNLVREYSDQVGFYHRFVSDNLSSAPQSVKITLSMEETELTEENTQIWAFGFDGKINFVKGSVIAWSESELNSKDYVNLLIGFSNGLFEAKQDDGTFEEVKEKAMDDGETVLYIILVIIVIVVLVVVVLYILTTRNIRLADSTKIRRIPVRKVEMMTSVPFKGSIPMTCAALGLDIASIGSEPIASYIVKWQLDEIIRMDDVESNPIIYFLRIPDVDKVEQQIFEMLKNAGDGEALKLEDWEKWSVKNYKKIESWQKKFKEYGEYCLKNEGWANKDNKGKMRFTKAGYDMHIRMLGFYQYLKNFKNSSSNMGAQREYWGDYLIFATLFNFAKPVTKGLQYVDAEGFDSFCGMYHMDPVIFLVYINHAAAISRSSYSGALEGTGADSFSSGGGGFSGGGGGGSR